MRRGTTRATIPATLRAQGRVGATFARRADGATHAVLLEESGGYRLRFPRVYARQAPCEAALINTGGGLAGGDRLSIGIEALSGARVVVTTPAAERVYRSAGPAAQVDVAVRLEASAELAWLPQETILYSGARLERRLTIDMPAAARLILAETTIFGRVAMGELPGRGLFADRWRIRRAGRLVLAEEVRLDGQLSELLARPAIGNGARAAATAALISPQAEDRLDAARAAFAGARSECGASAWNGMLVARFLAKDPAFLRADLVRFLLALGTGGLPRLWAGLAEPAPSGGTTAVEGRAASMADW